MKVIINQLIRVYRPTQFKVHGKIQASDNSVVKRVKDISLWVRDDIAPHVTDIIWCEEFMTQHEIDQWNRVK